ncbi:hypothetical protein [[Mycobacterium] zoologicum]|uniref:hypothetical protein n=1 Tax=[Mycobacterium] zoologicum TaxID=2872311 RepID=UPI002CCF8258|nr:hypothetical protein [Mycolicibacter sp. MYC101]MEB3065673.1 hypothetical protein [Mycolicibacter sp. MYC101]
MTTPPSYVPDSALTDIAKIRREATRVAAIVHHPPDEIFSSTNSALQQQAALDAFYVGIRLLIEFLEVRPANRDQSASDTLPGWSISHMTQPEVGQLLAYHEDTSKHVVHFSTLRTNQIQVNEPDIRKVADDILAVWDEFARASAHPFVLRSADLAGYHF